MPAGRERRERTQLLLENFRGERPLEELFWEELGYDRAGRRLAWRTAPQAANEALAEAPALLAEAGEQGRFHVIYARLASERLHATRERMVVSHLLREHPHALFVFSNRGRTEWHFINVQGINARGGGEKDPSRRILRRLAVRATDRLRTAAERLSQLALGRIEEQTNTPAEKLSPPDIQAMHDEAFDVDALTRNFYEDYLTVFEKFKADMRTQSGDARWAHRYTLLVLGRCLFIYFVQQCFAQWKEKTEDEPAFMRSFWHAYLNAGGPEDSFFSRWFSPLFFEAFNDESADQHRHFPPAIQRALQRAPWLNERLFRPGALDKKCRQYGATVADERFRQLFAFLERYPFTLTEDGPLDQQVAVDPEMIGKVYESLVNVSSETDERGDAGIFYTPRTEIDLMCRLALVDYLTNHLGASRKDLLKKIVFALTPEEKRQVDEHGARAGVWPGLRRLLTNVTVVDPACGSGAFLVGMLHVLDGLIQRTNEQLGIDESAYERRQRIAARSLYGVDVMDWAVRAAALRLRLALLARAPSSPDAPPSTDRFRLRAGDALSSFEWDCAFPEVFEGEAPGFDIVIGNPPYVRQEHIADPALPPEEITRQSKRQYKRTLAQAVYRAFPDFFNYDDGADEAGIKIDKRSDLYVYFFFYGLHLLNTKGTFCFITSNSWLDVGYGLALQEFLLRQTHIRWIIDSREVRSFADADVNTAIAVCSSPDGSTSRKADAMARFVMLKAPFEDVLDSACWITAERQTKRFSHRKYRVFPIRQDELLDGGRGAQTSRVAVNGCPQKGAYRTGKWGGKYLRAPGAFWDILERHGDKLVRLGDVADVRFGIKTGANAFFFLDDEDLDAWDIEERYLVPALKNSRDAQRIVVDGASFPLKLFLCAEGREALKGTTALEYIRSAEERNLHERPTLAARSPWWSLGSVEAAPMACNYQIGSVQHFFTAENGLLASNNFLFVYAPDDPFRLAAALNSSWTQLWTNVMGRANFGGGLLKIETYETADIMTLDPTLIPRAEAEAILREADLFGLDTPARRRLDALVFEAAGFSEAEAKDVVASLNELVRKRHEKSKSR